MQFGAGMAGVVPKKGKKKGASIVACLRMFVVTFDCWAYPQRFRLISHACKESVESHVFSFDSCFSSQLFVTFLFLSTPFVLVFVQGCYITGWLLYAECEAMTDSVASESGLSPINETAYSTEEPEHAQTARVSGGDGGTAGGGAALTTPSVTKTPSNDLAKCVHVFTPGTWRYRWY